MIVIDEIDVSLDAKAQAHLAHELRELCKLHNVTLVFTSHSLALIQTLLDGELFYFEKCEAGSTLEPMSFNSVKSVMFGFKGFDRYLLTEDDVLEKFLRFIINRYCPPTFFSHQVIQAGGGGQVKGLMRRNQQYRFFAEPEHVISVLDGDQATANQEPNVHCIPLKNVEEALWDEYRRDDFKHKFEGGDQLHPKKLYSHFIEKKILSAEEIFELLCARYHEAIEVFAQKISAFLCRPKT